MQKKLNLYIVFMIISLALGSCLSKQNKTQKPIAKVYDKYLYSSDIENIYSESINPADSLQIVKAYVDRWVKKQLMLHRAEKNLTEKQKNVSQQLEDYRSSLLVFKYEQEYIQQKLDTAISTTEIETYYYENLSNFTLNEHIVKALFIKVRKDDSYYERIKSLYRSNNEEDIKTLDNLAYQVAIKYDYFNDQWVPLPRILQELPESIENVDDFLRNNKNFEFEDETFAYLLNIREVIQKGQTAPLRYEIDNIKSIILNKRKQKLIVDLEAKIYNDARNYNHFSIFVEQ